MAKGKKTSITEIKRINDEILLINGKEYVIVEDTKDIETATTMKISSNGNRLLRFADEKKKARIDVKRNIEIAKYTITDEKNAKIFAKGYDKSILRQNDKKEIISNAASFVNARKIINEYVLKEGANYDSQNGKSTFYLSEEV